MEEQLIRRDGPSRRRWCGGEVAEEARRIGYVAAPMAAVMMSQLLVQVSSTMVVGHLGELDLAAAAIAFSLANVSGFSVLVGMASGLETLCGQAYGAKQYHSISQSQFSLLINLPCLGLNGEF
ncbi:protein DETOXIFICATION 3-like [Curcuma longa]|uniref:protein DETOXIFICATION 3-like n=1 Tax=Curcuma longa TaxID=136217 RepID=UPI003D9F1046